MNSRAERMIFAISGVTGFTKACATHGDSAMFEILQTYYSIAAQAAAAADGRFIKAMGDGVLYGEIIWGNRGQRPLIPHRQRMNLAQRRRFAWVVDRPCLCAAVFPSLFPGARRALGPMGVRLVLLPEVRLA